MADPQIVVSEQEAIELIAFIVSSARGLVHEPKDYGPMRMIEATRRLSDLLLPQARAEIKPLLTMLSHEIETWQSERRRDPAGYVAFIDECCRRVARELKRREAESENGHE